MPNFMEKKNVPLVLLHFFFLYECKSDFSIDAEADDMVTPTFYGR